MTYKTLLREMVQKMDGVLLREDYDAKKNLHQLYLHYEGDEIFYTFGWDDEDLCEEAFHVLANAAVRELMLVQGLLTE